MEPGAARAAADAHAEVVRRGNLIGAAWIVAAALGATVMTVAIRMLSPELDSRMIAFLRSSLGLAAAAAWIGAPLLLARARPGAPISISARMGMRFSRPGLHAARGVLMGVALNLGFYAIVALDLATATVLFFLAPVFLTAMAGPFLGERVGPRRWAAVGIGLLGAVVILRPAGGALELGALAGVGSAACFATALLISKILAPIDGARSVLASSTAGATLVTFPIALGVWRLPSEPELWLWIGVLVAASSARMYADIRGYAAGEASFLAPFAYVRLLFAAAVGWLLFAEALDAATLAGGGVIMAATLYIARREARLGRQPGAGAAP